ncbi:hypothetical protein ACSSS7_002220 [Eimeria intestinalis]
MGLKVSNKFSRPPMKYSSATSNVGSRRQRLLLFFEAWLFPLCSAWLNCSLSSASSFIAEDSQNLEETNSATGGRQNHSLLGSDEGFPSTSHFTSEQSFFFPNDADAPKPSGANQSPTQAAAQSAGSSAAAAEKVSFEAHRRKGARFKCPAAASLLLAFLAVSVAALMARGRQAPTAVAEGQGPQLKVRPSLPQTNAEADAAAADAKVEYLVKLEAGANELTRVLKSGSAALILHKVTNAIVACKKEAEAFHQSVRHEEQQQEGDLPRVAGDWARFTHFYSVAVEEVSLLVDTASTFIRAQAEAASNTHLEMLKIHARVERLCDRASVALENKIGEPLLRVSQSAVSDSLKQLHLMHETSARFTHLLASRHNEHSAEAAEATGESAAQTSARARDLGLVLENAVGAARVTARGNTRTRALLRDTTQFLQDTERALLLLSRSRAAWLALDLATKKIQMQFTCSELGTVVVPDPLSDAVNLFTTTAQDVDSYAEEVALVQQQLLKTTDAVEAMTCTRRAERACEVATQQISRAPLVSLAPLSSLHSEKASAAAESAAPGSMVLTVAGINTLVQRKEHTEEQRQARLLRLRSELGLESGSGGSHLLQCHGLLSSVLAEVKSMLREQARSIHRTGVLYFEDLYECWDQIVADAEDVSGQLERAFERLASVKDIRQLQLEAGKTLDLMSELANLSVDSVYHAADYKAWAVAERAFAAALLARAKAAEALTGLQREQQQQHKERKEKLPNVSAVSSLVAAFEERFKEGSVVSALGLVSKTTDEVATIEDYVHSLRLS